MLSILNTLLPLVYLVYLVCVSFYHNIHLDMNTMLAIVVDLLVLLVVRFPPGMEMCTQTVFHHSMLCQSFSLVSASLPPSL
jgi:hypothetical protein